ncbi:MAG: hypothetical protein ACI857_000074 [Arenicella sp.]|jgi:hypothetical protein
MSKILLILVLFTNSIAHSQTDSIKTSKIELFPSKYGQKNWRFLIGLDARRSYFASTKIKINGLRLGTVYQGVHRFGFGFYWLNKNISFNDINVASTTQDLLEPEVRFNLGYSSIFYERVFLKTRWWEVDFPIHLGAGRIIGTYKDTLGAFQKFTEEPFSALIPSAQVKFYPFTWLAIRGSGGYRFTMSKVTAVKKTFRNAFYGYGLSINVLGLYRAIFKKEEINEKLLENDSNEIR